MKVNIFNKIGDFILNLFSREVFSREVRDIIIRTDESVKRIDKDFDDVKKDVNKMKEDVAGMRPQVDLLWKRAFAPGHSPMVLNEAGQRIFNQSGIKSIILENKEVLLNAIKEKSPQTAYRVQELAEEAVNLLKEKPGILSRLQEGAFRAGVDVSAVLFTGSIFLRDIALEELGFKVEDLDNR